MTVSTHMNREHLQVVEKVVFLEAVRKCDLGYLLKTAVSLSWVCIFCLYENLVRIDLLRASGSFSFCFRSLYWIFSFVFSVILCIKYPWVLLCQPQQEDSDLPQLSRRRKSQSRAQAKFSLVAIWEGWSQSQTQFFLLVSTLSSLINNPMHLIFPSND